MRLLPREPIKRGANAANVVYMTDTCNACMANSISMYSVMREQRQMSPPCAPCMSRLYCYTAPLPVHSGVYNHVGLTTVQLNTFDIYYFIHLLRGSRINLIIAPILPPML
jgi:hypothetical protein